MVRRRITLDQVRHVAALARLELGEGELERYAGQLDSILEYMAELDAVDVSDVPPTHLAIASEAPMREDRVEPSLRREEVLSQAPQAEDGGFAVPRVVES